MFKAKVVLLLIKIIKKFMLPCAPTTAQSPAKKTQSILLISYYCPTRAHAGGLRILDIYKLIKSHYPNVECVLYTYKRPEIDWKYDCIDTIFDDTIVAPEEELSLEGLQNKIGQDKKFDIIDCQFLQSMRDIKELSKIGDRIVFTPMELLTKSFIQEVKDGRVHSCEEWKSLAKSVIEELEAVNFAHSTVCVSKSDAEMLDRIGFGDKAKAIETGLSSIEFPIENQESLLHSKEGNIVLYIAYFGSATNVEALHWFIENVHSLIKENVENYTLQVVGRGDLSSFEKYKGDYAIDFVGEVEDLVPYIRQARVGIAPALFGAGFRGKINQYAFYGVPCVATSISAEGLRYSNGISICIEDEPKAFAGKCIMLLKDDVVYKRMSEEAKRVCVDNYTWDSKIREIETVYRLR